MAKALFLEMREKNELVHIRYDELLHENMKKYPRYLQTVRKLKRIALENSMDSAIASIATGTFAHSELTRLVDMGFDYALFWPDGSAPIDDAIERELIAYCKELDQGPPWMLMGHIIDWSEKKKLYPFFHDQAIVLNLKAWSSRTFTPDEPVDLFQGGDRRTERTPYYKKSDENIHDDYTPMWIERDDSISGETGLTARSGVFNRFFLKAINMGFRIYNWPPHLREMKECYYLEDHAEETNNWMFSDEFYMQSDDFYNDYKHYMKQNDQRDKAPLFALKRQTENIVYITNTESVPQWNAVKDFRDTPLDTYVMPCSGFNQFEFMLQHIDTLKNVVFYDANRNSIAWMKHLINDWDGVSDLYEFIDDYLATLDSRISKIYKREDVEKFLKRTTEEQRVNLFIKLRDESVQYIHCDVMRQWNLLVDAVPEGANVLINLTNIWRYEGNFINNTLLECDHAFYGLMDGLVHKSNEVLFKGDTPKGVYIDCVNISSRGGFI